MVRLEVSQAKARQHPGSLGPGVDERPQPTASLGNERNGRPAIQGGFGAVSTVESGKDPAPIHELVEGDVARQELEAANTSEADEEGEAMPGSSEFLLEKDLQRYLAENLDCIEPGLRLYEDDDLRGIEFEAGGGRRIDILALDKSGAFVVLELKVSRGYDRVVGQLLRYMNWVRKELAEPSQKVRGIIVCRTISEDLRLACASIKNIELCEYTLSVTVSKVPPLELPT